MDAERENCYNFVLFECVIIVVSVGHRSWSPKKSVCNMASLLPRGRRGSSMCIQNPYYRRIFFSLNKAPFWDYRLDYIGKRCAVNQILSTLQMLTYFCGFFDNGHQIKEWSCIIGMQQLFDPNDHSDRCVVLVTSLQIAFVKLDLLKLPHFSPGTLFQNSDDATRPAFDNWDFVPSQTCVYISSRPQTFLS